MRQIILYGISGIDHHYRPLGYYCVFEQDISIWYIRYQASMLMEKHPGIEQVYAVDNRSGLKREYAQAIKEDSVESCVGFKDFLEREGVRIF